MGDYKITEHFSFFEVTTTNEKEFIEVNRIEAVKFIDNIKLLCINVLEPLRELVGPIRINSLFRCDRLNQLKGGAKNSQHLLGQASDINAICLKPDELYKTIKNTQIIFDQCIYENTWVHISYSKDLNRKQFLVYNNITKKYVVDTNI